MAVEITVTLGYFSLQVNSNPLKNYRVSDYTFWREDNKVGLKNIFSNDIILSPTIYSDWNTEEFIGAANMEELLTYLNQKFKYSGSVFNKSNFKHIRELPNNFYVSTLVNSENIMYKTDTYRTLNLGEIIGQQVNNSNEVIRIGNNLYFSINYTYEGPITQKLVLLKDCYIEDNELKFSAFLVKDSTIRGVHTMAYNEMDGFLYISNKFDGEGVMKILKVEPHTLEIIKSTTFPDNTSFRNASTDIKIFNNKLYFPVGYDTTYKVLELSTNLEDYTEIYSITTPTPTRWHQSNQPFEIHDGNIYITCYDDTIAADRLTHTKIIEVNLLTKTSRSSGKIPVGNAITGGNVGTHWMAIYNNKIILTTYSYGAVNYYASIIRVDIKTLLLEEELPIGYPITDDNSIIDGYMYINGESFFGAPWIGDYPNYPLNNAKLLKINPLNFTDSVVELDPYNSGYGSYGSINYNAKATIELAQLR